MDSKRKIAIIGSAHPLRGGLATYNERLARAFIAKGDDVTIYTFSLQYPSFLFPGKTQYSDSPAPTDIKIKVCVNSVNPLNWVKTARMIRKTMPDIVIIKFWIPFMGPCFGKMARIIKKNKHSRIISIIDNIIPHEKRIGDRSLAKYFVKPVDGFIAMSESVMKDIEKFDAGKPKIFCPHPLYDNFGALIPKTEAINKLGLSKDFSYMLFFGFIRDYKGLDLILNAMPAILTSDNKIRLLVAGEFYTDAEQYHKIIRRLNIENSVILRTDFIPDENVAEYFSAADVVVQPYKDATQSGVTQIAYHFNKPMIVTNVGGLAEIIPDGEVGYVVPPDADSISEAVIKFYSQKKEDEFTANAAEEKKKYSWERMIKAIEEVLG